MNPHGDDLPTTGENQSGVEDSAQAPEADGQPEPEFIAGPVAFKTSGTFLRDRVAETLAEQGFESDEASSPKADEQPDAGTASGGVPSVETESEDGTEPVGTASEEPRTERIPVQGSSEPEREPATERIPARNQAADASSEPEEDEARTEALPRTPNTDEHTSGDVADAAPRAGAAAATPVAPTGPATKPFRLVDDGGNDDVRDADTGRSARTDVPAASDDRDETTDARTEAVPVPELGAAAFSGAAPHRDDEAHSSESGPAGEAKEAEPGATAETATLWPQPRRLSDYVSDRPSPERLTQGSPGVTGTGATAAGAAGAAGLAGTASASTPSGAPAPAGAPGGSDESHGSSAEHGAGASGGSRGPGGPKGPPGGPGGPKGPGDEGPGDENGKKQKRKKPLWQRLLLAFLVATGLMIILAGGVFAFFYSTVEVPDAAKADAVEQGSTFYFADGETEFAYRGTDRDVISFDEMTAGGDHVVEAVVSAEDRGFWTEPGVSLSGTMRAVWSTVTGEQVQGGSTVTQQMVRNYYEGVSLEQTVSRKIQEIIISIKVDQSEDKEWVMEQYLNTIYFGRMSYGVQAAAQAYYHKDVGELTAEESAFLAAAIQQPTRFGQADVETTPAMENRWQYVVDGMVTTEAITQAEADAMEFPAPEPEKTVENITGYRGYMLQEAMSELTDLGYTEDHIQRQGFKIVTTFDEDMMDAAYEAVEEMVPPEDLPEGVNIGLTTIDPATGEVLAFYGGHDYVENQYDSSFLGAAQAGSAFKPYVLATALEQGYGLNSTVDGRGPQTIQGSRVQNAGNAPGGVMTLTQATTVSNNLGFVELAQEVGFEQVRDTAYDMGLPDGSIDDNQLVPVMPLGATSVRPVDQASGYATFANGGVHMDAHVVKEIVNQEGDNERPEIEGERALEESTASDVTYALEQVVSGGTGTAARLWDHPVAGKTGTTDGSVAAWFVGYTPQLATSVGVYSGNNESFSIPGHNISGGGLPASMWNSYMTRAMEGYERGSFPGPEFGGTTENWAPDPATQAPQEPPVQDNPEPEQPVEPVEPEEPADPEPEDPGIPDPPEDPGWPGEPEDPGIPEIPSGRGDEG